MTAHPCSISPWHWTLVCFSLSLLSYLDPSRSNDVFASQLSLTRDEKPAAQAQQTQDRSGLHLQGAALIDSGNKIHALLVGCTKYDHHPSQSLKGPTNDVLLMEQLLLNKFRVPQENITLLREGLNGKESRPTRANIQRAFAQLAQDLKDGEKDQWAVIFLSGHGSWQPDPDPTSSSDPEPDLKDEVFCPADVQFHRTKGGFLIRNGIVDDELRVWLAPILKKARVWLIVDSCHSGNITRSGSQEVVRSLRPFDTLNPGIDTEKLERGRSDEASPMEAQLRHMQRLVAFFASLPYQRTIEAPYPEGEPNAKTYGLFTYILFQTLNQAQQPLTFRELMKGIQARYNHRNRYWPTPMMEGLERDRVVLGTQEFPQRSAMQISQEGTEWLLNQGSLHDVTKGSILGVFSDIKGMRAGQAQPIGYVQVNEVRPLTSVVQPLKFKNIPRLSQVPQENYCRFAVVDYSFNRVKIAIDPFDADGQPLKRGQFQKLQNQLSVLRQKKEDSTLVEVVEKPSQAEWLIRMSGNERVLVPRSTTTNHSAVGDPHAFRITAEEPLRDWLKDRVLRLARASNLLRLATSPQNALLAKEEPLQVKLQFIKYANEADQKGIMVDTTSRPVAFTTGDRVGFVVTNTSPVPVDLHLVAVDSHFGITLFLPRRDEDAPRLQPGDSLRTKQGIVGDKNFGLEHLVLIAINAQNRGQETSPPFVYLRQEPLEIVRRGDEPKERPEEPTPLDDLLWQFVIAPESLRRPLVLQRPRVAEHTFAHLSWVTVEK